MIDQATAYEASGACEVISDQDWKFWDDDRENTLTHSTNMKLITMGARNLCLHFPILDIKDGGNIWAYDDIEGKDILTDLNDFGYAVGNVRQGSNVSG